MTNNDQSVSGTQASAALPKALLDFLAAEERLPIDVVEPLNGGAISQTVRILTTDNEPFVVKFCASAPADLYSSEADGLNALRHEGCPRVPKVISVSSDYLLLEDLGRACQESASFWEDLGRGLATLHRIQNDNFGYHRHNYLGLATQFNAWHSDGHEFFIQNRVLRYLDEGQCRHVLTVRDRRAIEFFCEKLRERVPQQPASLSHGDLWLRNLVVTEDGSPAYVDPAVYYGWAEADLGMTTQYGRFGDAFYDAYAEHYPMEPGWRMRLELYHIKEWLSMVAHFGEAKRSLVRLREFLLKYA